MNREDKVPLREQCQKLFELGIRVSAEHSWYFIYGGWKLVDWQVDKGCMDDGRGFPAPDVAELGEIFYELCAVIFYSNEQNKLTVQLKQGGKTLGFFYGETIAQALCSALIWAIESRLFKSEVFK